MIQSSKHAFLPVALLAGILLFAACGAAPPRGLEPVEAPPSQTENIQPRETPDIPSPSANTPTFDQTALIILNGILPNFPDHTKKPPIIRIAKEDFTSDGRLDSTWIAKHLRLQLNSLANGRAYFVDSLSDQHAESRSRSDAQLGGEWNLAPVGYRLRLELVDSKKQQMLWESEMVFR